MWYCRISKFQKYASIVKPTRCTIFGFYWISLYMFRTVFPSIIRNQYLYIQHQVYVIQVHWLLASGPDFHLRPVSKHSTNLYEIHLTLYVQSWTPDDGRKDRPKHVEWYLINSKNCASSWFWHVYVLWLGVYWWNVTSECPTTWRQTVTRRDVRPSHEGKDSLNDSSTR